MSHHQKNRFSGFAGSLQTRTHPDVADFDDAIRPVKAHEGAHAQALAGVAFHHCIEPRVAGGFPVFQPASKRGFIGKGAVGHPGPDVLARDVLVERCTMMRHIHRVQPDPAAGQRAEIGFGA